MTQEDIYIARRLKALRGAIPKNTYQTVIGQIAAGQGKAALKGIMKLEERIRRSNEQGKPEKEAEARAGVGEEKG